MSDSMKTVTDGVTGLIVSLIRQYGLRLAMIGLTAISGFGYGYVNELAGTIRALNTSRETLALKVEVNETKLLYLEKRVDRLERLLDSFGR